MSREVNLLGVRWNTSGATATTWNPENRVTRGCITAQRGASRTAICSPGSWGSVLRPRLVIGHVAGAIAQGNSPLARTRNGGRLLAHRVAPAYLRLSQWDLREDSRLRGRSERALDAHHHHAAVLRFRCHRAAQHRCGAASARGGASDHQVAPHRRRHAGSGAAGRPRSLAERRRRPRSPNSHAERTSRGARRALPRVARASRDHARDQPRHAVRAGPRQGVRGSSHRDPI